jgi:hypothetical protein
MAGFFIGETPEGGLHCAGFRRASEEQVSLGGL